ncbi:MAG: SURF1 family protein [Pseudomonadota bacterium]
MRFWGILALGLVGAGILVSLGIWQVQRLAWKQDVLAKISEQISSDPIALPQAVSEDQDEFRPVVVQGQFVGDTVRVLVSQKLYGAGYRLIAAFDTGARRVLVDRGFVSVNDPLPSLPSDVGTIVGNLHWPNEVDSFTPENDLVANMWFARTVPDLAAHLQSDPVLIIRGGGSLADPGVTPLPVTTDRIPNNHLNYAITWFLLALIWLGMTGYFLYRTRHTA